MEMNQTRLKVLCYLAQQTQYTSYAQLAETFGMTDRMARKHVDCLEEFLRAKGMGAIDRKYGKGIRIAANKALKEYILNWQTQRTPCQYAYTRQEREEAVMTALLLENQPILQKNLAEALNVSSGTIVREMDRAQAQLQQRGLTVMRQPNVGASVSGDEAVRQQTLLDIYKNRVNYCSLKAYMDGDMSHLDGSRQIAMLFEGLKDGGKTIFCGLQEIERVYELQFGDHAFAMAFLRCAILICRSRAKAVFPPKWGGEQPVETADEKKGLRRFLQSLEQQYGVILSQAEQKYLLAGLLTAKTVYGSLSDSAWKENLRGIVDRMIRQYEEVSGIAFDALRDELSEGLIRHLEPVTYALRFGFPLGGNCSAGEFIDNRDILLHTKMVLGELEESIGKPVDENECALIAVHFAAVCRKLEKTQKKNCKILLVCGAGIGISNLIAMQLHEQFRVDTMTTASSRQFQKIPRDAYQCVISTMEIDGLKPNDYVQISAQYTLEDQKKVAKALDDLLHDEPMYAQMVATSEGLMKRLERHGQVMDRQQLQFEFLDELLKNRQVLLKESPKSVIREPNLWDVVSEETIALGFVAEDWRQAVQMGASLLEKAGAVEGSYQTGIIRTIEELGPYMAIMPGVFLSHGENKGNVHRVAVGFVTLPQGVTFGQKDCDPIRLLITLSATDGATHLKAVAQLFTLLRQNGNVERIIDAKTKCVLMKLMRDMRQEGN